LSRKKRKEASTERGEKERIVSSFIYHQPHLVKGKGKQPQEKKGGKNVVTSPFPTEVPGEKKKRGVSAVRERKRENTTS